MGIFSEPFAAYRQAHQIIWKMGGWRYLSVPIILSALLAPLLLAGCYFGAETFSGWLGEGLLDPDGWMMTLVAWTFFLLGLLPCYVLFRVLVMLLYGPFLDRLAVKAEKLLRVSEHGQSPAVPDGSFLRMALVNVFVMGLSLILMVAGFVVGLIPVVGFLTGLLLFFPLQMFLASLPLLDPAFERGGYTLLGSVGLTLNHFGRAVVFSTLCFLLMAIPVVGWFLGPTYAVVAGIVLGIRIRERVGKPERI